MLYQGPFQVSQTTTVKAITVIDAQNSAATAIKISVPDQEELEEQYSELVGETLFYNAAGDTIDKIEQLGNDKRIQVSLNADRTKQMLHGDTITILLAVYDPDGKMEITQFRKALIHDSGLLFFDSFELPDGPIGSIRLFVVDEAMTPLLPMQCINSSHV